MPVDRVQLVARNRLDRVLDVGRARVTIIVISVLKRSSSNNRWGLASAQAKSQLFADALPVVRGNRLRVLASGKWVSNQPTVARRRGKRSRLRARALLCLVHQIVNESELLDHRR